MSSIILSCGETRYQHTLIADLLKLGYERVPMVFSAGDVAVRGDIVDIFLYQSTHPIRLEFDLDCVRRLHFFSVHSQLKTHDVNQVSVPKKPEQPSQTRHTLSSRKGVSRYTLSDFEPGHYVVHAQYGVGIFEGVEYKQFATYQGEYLLLKYKGDGKVYIPIDQLGNVYPYRNTESAPVLNNLNDNRWNAQKKKAKGDTTRLAESLFITYKRRQREQGFSCGPDTDLQLSVEQEFPYPLTADQQRALTEIKKDMESIRPMNRLLCGDVGYGKTEVMVCAALKALENGKQVAVLAPTTVLAEQHFETFLIRLKNTPYIVASLSRFVDKASQRQTVQALKAGRCDLVVGTHRLLSRDVQFHDLGLLIVDEEQRFGVSHKEKIKRIKHHVDMLYVSATPIPRTLYMSVAGSTDMSVIETPPLERVAVVTEVRPINDACIQDAIETELDRKGQIFYVHNVVKTIQQKATSLQRLVPSLRVTIVYGQLDEYLVKERIQAFKRGEIDCLVSTTIIENGIDIPNANTIIIDGCERLGLAQIHQLRGRVGRGKVQAYATLLYNNARVLSQEAAQRLAAIREYMSLGSGYDIALRDLEIRGAGNILGKEQHGHLINVGFEYYCQLLEESVAAIKGEAYVTKQLPLETRYITLPEQYVANARERLALYQRFLSLQTVEELGQLEEDLLDRYGRFDSRIDAILSYLKQKILETA